LDTGILPIDRFLAHVGRSGYRGTLTLELDIRPYADDRDELVRFLSSERERAQRWLRGELPAPGEPRDPDAVRLADELALDETGVGVPSTDRTPAPSGHAPPGSN